MEILAPAGNFESFLAAVHNGADAVYLAGKDFGARAFAGNFSLEEIAAAVCYAHLREVKVYVTVNTLLRDDELSAAVDLCVRLYNIGVDAIIIQDWGLISVLRSRYPEIPLNASTQMTFHNSLGCRKAEELGFKRVILAREVSIAEMAEINRKVDVETEVFVHGALCLCYSGQCLFSSLVGGRSGNRGRCAQPCRLKYRMTDQQGQLVSGHLLSPKDLNGYGELEQIEAAGVVSAKIEGRMKRPEYVATVVRAYAAVEADSDREAVERSLKQAFNREFTSGYLLKDQGRDLMSYKRPNNRGTKLGRIENVSQDAIWLKLDDELAINDGLEIWVTKGGRQGFEVTAMSVDGRSAALAAAGAIVKLAIDDTGLIPANIRTGDRVFKTLDGRLNAKVRATYANYDTLAVDLRLTAHCGKQLELVGSCKGEKVSYEADFIVPLAEKHPADYDSVHKQLSRMGGSGFYLSDLQVELDSDVMLPASVLNQARREVLAQLTKALLKPWQRAELSVQSLPAMSPAVRHSLGKVAVQVADFRSAQAALDGGADLIYLDACSFRGGRKVGRAELAQLVASGTPLAMVLPVIVKESESELWQRRLSDYRDLEVSALVVGNIWGLELAREVGFHGELVGDFALNCFNSYSAEFWRSRGLKRLGVSPELNFKQLGQLEPVIEYEALAAGNLQMMLTEHCLIGANFGNCGADSECSRPCVKEQGYRLQDDKGFEFPVYADEFCRNHIYNGHMLMMIEDLPKFIRAQVDVLRLDLRHLQPEQVSAATEIFTDSLRRLQNGLEPDLAEQKAELSRILARPFTKGHYYRGVE